MTRRKGLGKGQGKGFKNIIPPDPQTHSLSARGIKQKQSIAPMKSKSQYSPEEYRGIKLTFKKKRLLDGVFVAVEAPQITKKEFLTVGRNKEHAMDRAKISIDVKLKERQFKKDVKKFRFKRPKIFYYKIIRSNPRTYGGRNETAEVFEHTPKGLVRLGEVQWNTAGYKGEESEVSDLLVEKKRLKPEQLDRGYYHWSNAQKMNFKIEKL